jgi:hypothetical protein
MEKIRMSRQKLAKLQQAREKAQAIELNQLFQNDIPGNFREYHQVQTFS